MREYRLLLVAGAAVGILAFSAGASLAETLEFKADLTGEAESPPNQTGAEGHARFTLDTDTWELGWNVEFSGLSGPAIGAHIHGPAEPGANAGIMIPFTHLQSPITGSFKINPEQEQALVDGKLYVNIHTKAHPGGELRGQIQKE